MALICNTKASANFVYEQLFACRFNVRRISDLTGTQKIYGVMVKVRKNIKDPLRVKLA